MKKDFSKILVERERRGGTGNRKGRQPRDLDDLPRKQGMRKAHKDRKSLNENLAPLRRFLRSNVGRPWDKVYSEICENISLNSAVQRHILEHLFHYVEIHVHAVGKKIYENHARWGSAREIANGELYVDPKTGILRKYKRIEKIKPEKPYRDAFHMDLNRMLSGSKSQTVLHDDTFWKVYKNPTTGEWDLFNKANATHAHIDFKHFSSHKHDLQTFFHRHWKKIASHGSSYIKTLISLFDEWIKKENKKSEAKQRKKEEAERLEEIKQKEANRYYQGVFK